MTVGLRRQQHQDRGDDRIGLIATPKRQGEDLADGRGHDGASLSVESPESLRATLAARVALSDSGLSTESDDRHDLDHRRDPPPGARRRDQPDPDHRGDPHAALAEGAGTSVGFLLGWIAGIVVAVTVFTLLASVIPPPNPGDGGAGPRHDPARAGRAAAPARRAEVARPAGPGEEPAMPKWMQRHRHDPPSGRWGSGCCSRRSTRRTCAWALVPASTSARRTCPRARWSLSSPSSLLIAASTVAIPVIGYLIAAKRLRHHWTPCAGGWRTRTPSSWPCCCSSSASSLIGKGIASF